jgi:putative ABC transport system permease protein
VSGLWPLVMRAIRARPLRSSLTAIAVALGIAVVLGVQITVNGLDAQASAAQQLRAGASGLDVRVDAGDGLTPAQVLTLGSIKGVAQAVPLYEKRVVGAPAGSGLQGLTVSLVGLQDGSAALRPVQVVSGRLPHNGSFNEVAIDTGLSQALTTRKGSAVRVGQKIQLITATGPDEFVVVGTTSGTSAGPAFTRSAVFVDNAAMLSEFKLGLRTPLVALRLFPSIGPATVASEVHAKLGSTVTTYDPNGAGLEPLADLRPLLTLITLLSLVMGAGVTANSVALTVLERRREIGLLRAAGASTAQVFRLFAAEALVLSALAVPVGIGVGIALGAFLGAHYTPTDLPTSTFSVSAGQVLLAIVAGLGAGILGGLIPAIAAGRTGILNALRLHPQPPQQRVNPALPVLATLALVAAALCFISAASGLVALGVALFLLGVVLSLPALLRIVARGVARLVGSVAPGAANSARSLARGRNRTALTAAGLAVSVAFAVAVSALTAGAFNASDGWVSHLFVGDTVISSPVTQRDAVANAVRDSPDITAATPLRFFSEPVAGAVLGITALEPTVYAGQGGLDVVTPERIQALSSLENGPSFVAPAQLASASGWHVGTQLPVQTIKGTVFFTITGVVNHSFPGGDGTETLVMANDLARTYFGPAAAGFDALVATTDGAAGNVQALAATYGMHSVTVSDIGSAARDALQHSIGLLLALAIVSVTIAMLALINTLVVNVRQGTRELTLLRVVGMDRRQALRLVIGEAGLLTLTAALLGVGVGCLIALPMLRASSGAGFNPVFAFPGITAVVLALTVLIGALIATFGPARRAASTSVLDALRHE